MREVEQREVEARQAALHVFRDTEVAQAFLSRPHALLHGRTPLAVAAESADGLRSVVKILGRLKHGTAA